MFKKMAAERWRPDRRSIAVLLVLSAFALTVVSAVSALHGPILLGYTVAPDGHDQWRISGVFPGSYAWDAGLRPGMVLRGTPVLQGAGVVYLRTGGACCRALRLPPAENSAPALAGVELVLGGTILSIGGGTLLFARERRAAALLLLFCFNVAIGFGGVAAFAHGARWGGVLFALCWFAFLPALMLPLAAALPSKGRTLTVLLTPPAPLVLAAVLTSVQVISLLDTALYLPLRNIGGGFFLTSQIVAVALWCWRALPERRGRYWPEYRLVLLGLCGAFGGFALLAVLPTMLDWRLPWPVEANSFVVALFPLGLSWALLRHRLLGVRRTVQRAAVTGGLLSGVLCAGLAAAGIGQRTTVAIVGVVLAAGIGVPLAQRFIDSLLPDARDTYATLVHESGRILGLAVEIGDIAPVLASFRRGLGLASLVLRRDGAVLAQAPPALAVPPTCYIEIDHEGAPLAMLEVGEKLYHDTLLPADHAALAILQQQLAAFLARAHLIEQLRSTVTRLEVTQERLLTARRLERERLGQYLHRGPLQEILLLRQALPEHSAQAVAADELARALRTILTETASAALRDLGLSGALRIFVSHMLPYAHELECAVVADIDERARLLAPDESFALYQLAHEAIVNAVRHSGARRVVVRISVAADVVALEVGDDGRGLPAGWDRIRIDHRGLQDALALVQTVRGAAAWAETPDVGGTVVRATMPLRTHRSGQKEGNEMDETPGTKIRLLIAEDHVVVRQGLRSILTEDSRLSVVAEACTGYEILALVLQHRPDVLLLDIDLPGQNGLEAVASLRTHLSQLPRTLILSAFLDEEYVRRAREMGIDGFLSKACDGASLREAVFRVMSGSTVLDSTVATIVKKQNYSPRGQFRRYSDGSQVLTATEAMVLQHMVGDAPYEEIAEQVGRSYSTVRTQAAAVCQKLGVNSRQQAVLKGLQLGILHIEGTQIGREV